MIRTKRVYDLPEKDDGFRILVDRLWPRGLSKGEAKIDLWLREIAPSHQLRRWFSHDPEKFGEFQRRYEDELSDKSELVLEIKQIEREKGVVTLLYSAKEEKHNNAVVLRDVMGKL